MSYEGQFKPPEFEKLPASRKGPAVYEGGPYHGQVGLALKVHPNGPPAEEFAVFLENQVTGETFCGTYYFDHMHGELPAYIWTEEDCGNLEEEDWDGEYRD